MTSTMTTDAPTVQPLTALDRCDRCGAQAYVRASLSGGGELLFCAHHGREYTPRLLELDATILDESVRLDETAPTPAASAGI